MNSDFWIIRLLPISNYYYIPEVAIVLGIITQWRQTGRMEAKEETTIEGYSFFLTKNIMKHTVMTMIKTCQSHFNPIQLISTSIIFLGAKGAKGLSGIPGIYGLPGVPGDRGDMGMPGNLVKVPKLSL